MTDSFIDRLDTAPIQIGERFCRIPGISNSGSTGVCCNLGVPKKSPRTEIIHQKFAQNTSKPIKTVDRLADSVKFVTNGPVAEQSRVIMRGMAGKR